METPDEGIYSDAGGQGWEEKSSLIVVVRRSVFAFDRGKDDEHNVRYGGDRQLLDFKVVFIIEFMIKGKKFQVCSGLIGKIFELMSCTDSINLLTHLLRDCFRRKCQRCLDVQIAWKKTAADRTKMIREMSYRSR